MEDIGAYEQLFVLFVLGQTCNMSSRDIQDILNSMSGNSQLCNLHSKFAKLFVSIMISGKEFYLYLLPST